MWSWTEGLLCSATWQYYMDLNRCSSKQQNYYCESNLLTNKWDELRTFSVTAWGSAMLTGPKPPSSFKQMSSAGSCQDLKYSLLYIIYIILEFYDTTLWFQFACCLGHLMPPAQPYLCFVAPSPQPCEEGGARVLIFLTLSSTVAPVCTLFPSVHTSHVCLPVAAPTTVGLIAEYL